MISIKDALLARKVFTCVHHNLKQFESTRSAMLTVMKDELGVYCIFHDDIENLIGEQCFMKDTKYTMHRTMLEWMVEVVDEAV